ncbi:PHP domain-containing protein [Methanocalculus taiwanensis]|uniref:PHP domain-containing protein n=1 Tax=Methanocalculus taiwanensis TaxID=106207 RepID=A0ABD4TG90_9EURY|nr:PHP domain-containing protein [Methanocalculus taiwanensis]MCQ1537521.1 PHP domain-containing protein [Methanocalculus taiwanensis]
MTLRCDLHIHTSYSRDGESRVEDIIRRAEEIGLDAIAITDHDTVTGARYALGQKTKVLIIPGIEVSTKEGHLLVLGVTDPIPAGLPVRKTIAIAEKMGGVTILPHPFHMWRHGVGLKLKDALELVDAVEAFNSRYIVGTANRKAARLARRLGKPCIGGSDAHHWRYVGYGSTLIDAEPTVESVLEAIRSGKTIASCRMTPLRTYTRQSLRSTWRRLQRRIPNLRR